MRQVSKLCIASAAVAMFSVGSLAFAQSVQTPYSPDESGMAEFPGSESATGPAAPAQGGTLAPDTSRTVRIEGGSAENLPMTPDSDPEYNRNGD